MSKIRKRKEKLDFFKCARVRLSTKHPAGGKARQVACKEEEEVRCGVG